MHIYFTWYSVTNLQKDKHVFLWKIQLLSVPTSSIQITQNKQEMVLESGYKIPEILDDFASAELLIQKKQSGPFFVSEETDGMFILTAHLKGFHSHKYFLYLFVFTLFFCILVLQRTLILEFRSSVSSVDCVPHNLYYFQSTKLVKLLTRDVAE